ncbi:SDR family oxidoreductase [Mesorhizobium sp. INR15]|uniref:SDR family oxidoreductase n=1 Tax=Mesorhizobium sp. INR15 TaxID=2654248 RepID=UPI00189653A7|nr:SDR family oxidoreductase [Mesorhizobium sp. INR15]QPC95508.1 SDR family oxidoreductase [Mesorhizobium sp. INR15]
MQLELEGKRALVLSSTRGLGLGIARALAAEGAHVLLCGRSEPAGVVHGQSEFIRADLADPDFAAKVTEAANEKLGGVDILVNNTGGPPPGTASALSAAVLGEQFSTMVRSIIETTGKVLPQMRERNWGRVLTIASSGVLQPIPNLAASNALRSALVGWSKTLASEVAGEGVCVNVLVPGRIATERLDELDASAAARQGKSIDEVRTQSRATIPMGRYGDVREFAAVATFLCSGQASYITGTVVRCDGGLIRAV